MWGAHFFRAPPPPTHTRAGGQAVPLTTRPGTFSRCWDCYGCGAHRPQAGTHHGAGKEENSQVTARPLASVCSLLFFQQKKEMRAAASALTRLAARALAQGAHIPASSTSTSAACGAALSAISRRALLHSSPPSHAAAAAPKATTGIVGLAVDPAARTTASAKLREVSAALDAAGVPADAQYRKGVDGLVSQR